MFLRIVCDTAVGIECRLRAGWRLDRRWRWRVAERVRRVRPAPAPVSEIRIWLEERELESLEL